MYDHILVSTDGSEAADRAIKEAFELAELCDATIHALYAIDQNAVAWAATGDDTDFDSDVSTLLARLEEDGEKLTNEIAAEAEQRGIDVTRAVIDGTPYRQILEYADDNDIDCIVMGTYGRRGLDTIFGSTTERVVRRANVPVMTVRYRQHD
ncbi:MAG: universal stress protein [Halobacteriales archaeon]